MDEKNIEMPALSGEKKEAPLSLEAQLGALAQQLSRALEKSAQADEERKNGLDQRENALKKQEMAASARAAMEKRGLPVHLAEGLVFEEEAAMEAAADALEESFRAAVQKAVEERLLSDAPKAAPALPLSDLCDEDYYAAVYSRS